MKTILLFLKSRRVWGLTGTALVLGALFYFVLGPLDASWLMPDTKQIAQDIIKVWPHMPFFAAQSVKDSNGNVREIDYTVPTHQFTRQEMAQMGMTNAVAHPAAPK